MGSNPPSNFRGDVVILTLQCYKKKSQAWGYRMRLLSSIFSQNGLSYKMPLRFNNLDIGEFSLVTKCPFVFNNCTYKDIPVAIKCQCRSQDCTCKGTSLLQNATLVSTRLASTNVHQASSFIIHHRSIQIMHHHAALSCLIMFEPLSPDPTSSFH